MKRIAITFVIVTLVATILDCILEFSPLDRSGHPQLFTGITLGLEQLPNIVLAIMLILRYRKEGTLQENLHNRYIYYLLLLVVVIPLLGILFHSNDTYSDISSIIYNIAITCIAYDFCKYRQPASCQRYLYILYILLFLSIIGILFIPVPTNMFFTYSVILIWLYAFVSFVIDANKRQYPNRGWIIVAAIFAAAVFIPAYLLETNHSELEN